MEKESFTIVNENEHDITGNILRPKKTGKFSCIIFSHGLLDDSSAKWIKTLSKKLLNDGYAIITFDYTNSFGCSGGKPENATITQWSKDLTRVVNYAKRRSYINNKIVVIGHCYGAMAALSMEGYNHLLKGLILISVPARIDNTRLTNFSPRELMKIKLKRYFHIPVGDQTLARINYSFLEDGTKIDIDRASRNLKTLVLIIHGEKDKSIPLENPKRVYERVAGDKKIVIIPRMEHEIKGASITKIYSEIKEFLKSI